MTCKLRRGQLASPPASRLWLFQALCPLPRHTEHRDAKSGDRNRQRACTLSCHQGLVGGASAAHALGFHSDRASGGADLDQSDQKLQRGEWRTCLLCFPLLCFLRSNSEVWGSKSNFPRVFLSSSEWADEQMNMRQINKREDPKFTRAACAGCPEVYVPVWTRGRRQRARGSEREQASQGRANAQTHSCWPPGRVQQRGS